MLAVGSVAEEQIFSLVLDQASPVLFICSSICAQYNTRKRTSGAYHVMTSGGREQICYVGLTQIAVLRVAPDKFAIVSSVSSILIPLTKIINWYRILDWLTGLVDQHCYLIIFCTS